jgi:hypothetical protein
MYMYVSYKLAIPYPNSTHHDEEVKSNEIGLYLNGQRVKEMCRN